MSFLKNLLAIIGAIVVAAVLFAFVKFDLGTRISQVSQLDPKAMGLYLDMFDKILVTGDPAKGMVIKKKMNIPEGMSKKEAIENAIEIMDQIGEEHGLTLVDTKLMSRGETDENGEYQPYVRIRSYCSQTIAKVFLKHSKEFIGFMPCRIGIVEDENGDVWILTMSMDLPINGGHPLEPKLLDLATEVRAGMYGMLEGAAKNED
ncbi:MAG: DUF302 domain-containing protein [Campylobacterales bacterium]|nr:DUF302 domain-containing protein [Campylobacterales bacterium]